MKPERELTRAERAGIRRLVIGLCANYDGQDKICLPLDCPCYMLHKWWTGALCRYFAAAVLPTDPALEAALTGQIAAGGWKPCEVCGALFAPTGRQVYCSDACRERGLRQKDTLRKRRRRQKQG